MLVAAAPAQPPTLVYAARFYDPRPKVRTYSHLYLWRVGQKGRGQILTTGANNDTGPKAAPSGKTVYFVRTRDRMPPTLCALNRATGKTRALYSATTPTDFLGNLRVSSKGFLLFKQAVYTPQSAHPFFEQWVKIDNPESHKPFPVTVWRSATQPKGEVEAVWAANADLVLSFPPNTDTKWYPASISQIVAVTNHPSPEGEPMKVSLSVDARAADLKRDISPNGVWILGQASWSEQNPKGFKFAEQVRIDDDDWALVDFAAEPGEIMHWLTDRRVVGIAPDAQGQPARLHFFNIPQEKTKEGARYPQKPIRTVDLKLNTAAVKTALGSDYPDYRPSSVLTEVDTLRGRNDGFVLGTPDEYGYHGVRFWINAKTGAATLWSNCGSPHPSPNGTYFWTQASKEISKKRPYPDLDFYKPTLSEPAFGLMVASYGRPSHLIPLVSGKDRANGADWLPVAAPAQRNNTP